MAHSALRESLIPLQAAETSMLEKAETSMVRVGNRGVGNLRLNRAGRAGAR